MRGMNSSTRHFIRHYAEMVAAMFLYTGGHEHHAVPAEVTA